MSLKVLYLEDNKGDALLLRWALEQAAADVELKHFARAAQAFSELYAHGADLIVLDLLLPGDDCASFAKELDASPRFRDIPLVVLTHTNLPARELVPHALKYDSKPNTLEGWSNLGRGYVEQFGHAA